jgi:hypothetical protein
VIDLITAAGLTAILDDIGRDEARRRAVQELIKPEYQQESLLERAVRLIREFFDRLLDSAPAGVPGGVLALIIVILLIGVVVALVVWQARKATRGRWAATPLLGPVERTAAEHRAEAERLAAESRWAEAIQERLRAIARDLEHRAFVTPQPGRTADELAAAAGRELPEHAARLASAARLFDEVTYGAAPGSREGYLGMTGLDESLRTAKPALVSSSPAGAP